MSLMTYEEIGSELGVTKQAVRNNLKKAINKSYEYINDYIGGTPFESLRILTLFFGITEHKDFQQMYKLIDKKIKKLIEGTNDWKNNQ